jgi:hypothetical protein
MYHLCFFFYLGYLQLVSYNIKLSTITIFLIIEKKNYNITFLVSFYKTVIFLKIILGLNILFIPLNIQLSFLGTVCPSFFSSSLLLEVRI